MTKQDILLQIINNFYKQAVNAYYLSSLGQSEWSTAYMPDDPEEDDDIETTQAPRGDEPEAYNNLINVSHQVNDPGLASELSLVAEIYKRAIEINGGWNSINKAISNVINMYLDDEDNPQQEAVEDVLNEVVKDLRLRAGGQAALSRPDSPQIISKLKEVKEEYNSRTLQEEVDDLSKWQENAVSTFDYTGGVGVEDAGKGTGRGYSAQRGFVAKDWVQSTENERARYVGELENTKDPIVKNKIQKLVDVLSKLKTFLDEELKIMDTLAITEPEPEITARLEFVKEQITNLKKERAVLKTNIRNFELQRNLDKLVSDFQMERDPIKKMIIEQQIALNSLSQSKDVGKQKERNWRSVFIKSLSSGDTNPDNINKFKSKIEEAAALKKSIIDVRKEQAAQIGQEKRSGKLRGIVIFYGQNINTQRREIKRKIYPAIKSKVYDKLGSEEKTIFKPYIDEINLAHTNKDPERVKQVAKELNTLLSQRADTHPLVVAYNTKAKHLQDYEELLLNVSKPESNVDAAFLTQLIEMGKSLISDIQNDRIFSPIKKNIEEMIKLLEEGNIK